MSHIEDLLARLCPDGVLFRPLATLGTRNSGVAITASQMKRIAERGGPVRIFAGGQTVADVPEAAIDPQRIIRSPSIIVKSRGHIGFAYYDKPFSHKSELWSYTLTDHAIDQRFVYYFLLTQIESLQTLARATSVKLPQLGVKDTDSLRIPVPPLEVQREIVRILDTFTQLEAELEARRRQYEHYREVVWGSLAAPRWATLGSISLKVSSGGTPPTGRPDYYNGNIPWLRTQEVDYSVVNSTAMSISEAGLRNSSASWIPANCVIVAMYGATAAKVAISGIPMTTNQACCNLQVDPGQADFRYVFHWLGREYLRLKALGQGSQFNLNARTVKSYPIPVPSLDEQARVVSVLDAFDALVNDLSIGLPAELVARRKQYEHYRDRLLTFEEAV